MNQIKLTCYDPRFQQWHLILLAVNTRGPGIDASLSIDSCEIWENVIVEMLIEKTTSNGLPKVGRLQLSLS
jgi:hypothetical protein